MLFQGNAGIVKDSLHLFEACLLPFGDSFEPAQGTEHSLVSAAVKLYGLGHVVSGLGRVIVFAARARYATPVKQLSSDCAPVVSRCP